MTELQKGGSSSTEFNRFVLGNSQSGKEEDAGKLLLPLVFAFQLWASVSLLENRASSRGRLRTTGSARRLWWGHVMASMQK